MSSSNPPKEPEVPAWFSSIIMANLKNYVEALAKLVADTNKQKYSEIFADIQRNFSELNQINEQVRKEGRYQLNNDGAIEVDDNLQVKLNPVLEDSNVIGRFENIQQSLKQISAVSKNTFAANTSNGAVLAGFDALCDNFKDFHLNTKRGLEMAFFQNYFQEHPENQKEYLKGVTQKETWFDEMQMEKINLAHQIIKDHFGTKSEFKEMVNAMNDNIVMLKKTDDINRLFGPFARDGYGKIQVGKKGVEFCQELDDPNVSGTVNNLINIAKQLSAEAPKNAPVQEALNAVINNSIFESHREKKQALEEGFFKQYYLEQNPQPEISIASTTQHNFDDSPSLSRRSSMSDFSEPRFDDIASASEYSESRLSPSVSRRASIYAVESNEPVANEASAPESTGSNFWKYALIGAGIALGVAAIATGFGAGIGIPLLALSVGYAIADAVLPSAIVKPINYGVDPADVDERDEMQRENDVSLTNASTSKLMSGLSMTRESVSRAMQEGNINEAQITAKAAPLTNKPNVTPDYSPEPEQDQTPRFRR